MRRIFTFFTRAALLFFAIGVAVNVQGQNPKATLSGIVRDTSGGALQGARIDLDPVAQPASTDVQGAFLLNNMTPGVYRVTVSYVGFASYTTSVTLTDGHTGRIEAVLKIATNKQDVVVYGNREAGEADAINRMRAAENILQVLPSEVITSLPNANIADALGRMPSVTIERDEGEGKYVQIRGTEPRLSNTMVDGISIPSPESGVRQIKLDTIASDLVDSVEINKTLQANIDADGIGGSVNLVTKTATETPTISLYGLGGVDPIKGGRLNDQAGLTVGRRFLADKKLGVLIGGTYDYNGRGIDDIEPTPTPGSGSPHYDSVDLRDYIYQRTRYGATGTADYKFREGSDISARFLFSTFRNWGNKWVYTPRDATSPSYSQDWRRPNLAIGSLSIQGNHLFNANTIKWAVSVSRSRSLGGSGGASYGWNGDTQGFDSNNYPIKTDCLNDQSLATSVNRPAFSATCFQPGPSGNGDILDKNNYGFQEYDLPNYGQSVQLNLQASASYSRLYHVGSRFGTFEVGAKIRNAHKFDDSFNQFYTVPLDSNGNPLPNALESVAQHPEWNSGYKDPGYYDKTYGAFPVVTDWVKVGKWVNANKSALTFNDSREYTNDQGQTYFAASSNQFDLIERIPAGYVMNTIELASRVRLVAGLRIEATHVDTLSFDQSSNTLSFHAGGDYLDVLPSASLRFAIDKDSDLRLVYGRGLARPDPQDITASIGIPDKTVHPNTISLGNPNLKAERANNYDVLYERYLNPLGQIEVGYFYKDLMDPITQTTTILTSGPFKGDKASQPGNAGSAFVQGIEVGFVQRLSYLPSIMSGLGVSANYSYTSSLARGLPGRADHPPLLRQAPNTWNFSPTYDTKRFSMRVGMTYNDAMIYAYQWQDGADPTGQHGPSGDNYLYPHYQFDTQASYKLPRGFQVMAYGLNMNNEVFGFYNGDPKYVVQREYYKPTYAFGLRWDSTHEK